jgi:uncharacterized protein involved in exopolysaccharide biosynthesis
MTARDQNVENDHAAADEGEEEGFDLEMLKDVAGFLVRAPRRRPILAASAFVVVAAIGLTIAATMPRTYNAQVKLLAQRNLVLPALSNPTRAVPREADEPTRNVANIIMRRENMVAIINEAQLVERFYSTRSAALRIKDALVGLVSGPMTADDKMRAIVGTLEKRMQVFSDDSSVMINVDWSDPQVAYDIATLVQTHFLEARYDSEVAMIQDAIAVLEEHAKTELTQVDSALADYQKLQAEKAAAAPGAAAAPAANGFPVALQAPAAPRAAPGTTPALTPDPDLAKSLEAKRRQIRALEEERQRELDSLRQQLNQAQLTLTPMHPTVIGLRQKIESMEQPPPELEQLKAQENALLAEIAPPASSSTSAPGSTPAPHTVQAGPVTRALALPPLPTTREDPALTPARERLESAIRRYQDVTTRIDSARLELDISRTAFRYRYSVITPAELPRSAKKPIALLVGIASVVGAILAALLGAAAADLMGGRVIETWQVRRRFKLEVLGEFEGPK